MRTYDIPYVQNPASPTVQKPLEEMDLKEIIKTRLVNCAKSNGSVTKCRDCTNKCADGIQAVNMLYGKFMPPDAPPIIPTGTLLEKARQAQAEAKKAEAKKAKEKTAPDKRGPIRGHDGRLYMDGWYDTALEKEDPLQWIMDTFDLTYNAAKRKVCYYLHKHPDAEVIKGYTRIPKRGHKKTEEPKPEETKPAATVSVNAELLSPLEDMINKLMNQQEEYKKKIDEYQKLYDETKKKVDALYEALNILNEN